MPNAELQVFSLFSYDEKAKRALITDTTIVFEEISRPQFMDRDTIAPEIENHLNLGRHSRNNLIGIAQTPKKQTNTVYRAQMDMFISFRQTEDSAISFFSDFNKEKADLLPHLHCGYYELFRGTPEKLIEFINKP
jgi:hypothetical protein